MPSGEGERVRLPKWRPQGPDATLIARVYWAGELDKSLAIPEIFADVPEEELGGFVPGRDLEYKDVINKEQPEALYTEDRMDTQDLRSFEKLDPVFANIAANDPTYRIVWVFNKALNSVYSKSGCAPDRCVLGFQAQTRRKSPQEIWGLFVFICEDTNSTFNFRGGADTISYGEVNTPLANKTNQDNKPNQEAPRNVHVDTNADTNVDIHSWGLGEYVNRGRQSETDEDDNEGGNDERSQSQSPIKKASWT
eukprot:jgi/Psemu1/22570/gm1.22570_g